MFATLWKRLAAGFVFAAFGLIPTALQAQSVMPIVNCVAKDTATGTNTIYFGYVSFEGDITTIPIGFSNNVSPNPAFRGQPTEFLPGVHNKVFSVTYPSGGSIQWQLLDNLAYMNPSIVDANLCAAGISLPGPVGPQGEIGPQGPQGPQGQQGPQGSQGPQGATGPKGDTGAAGSKGDTGAVGALGPKGDTGAAGASGPQGVQGPRGSSAAGLLDQCVLRKKELTNFPLSVTICASNERLVTGGGSCAAGGIASSIQLTNRSWEVRCNQSTTVTATALCCPQ